MNQYCIYCSHCVPDCDGLYCCTDDRTISMAHAKHANTCRNYEESEQGNVITGRRYRPQKWRQMRVYNRDE